MTKMTEPQRKLVIDMFSDHGMCSDCIAELEFVLQKAELTDTSASWYEFLCDDCVMIYREMIPEALKCQGETQ